VYRNERAKSSLNCAVILIPLRVSYKNKGNRAEIGAPVSIILKWDQYNNGGSRWIGNMKNSLPPS
ncbi:MAG: hypothetical protein K2N56_04480, partial [Oscillospiraceae bacterium]|nr:hypothetical protein [Oscillospiraceae bacterium]